MAVNPAKLKSYMTQVAEDSAYPDYEDEEEDSLEEYQEEAEEELEEAGATGDYQSFMQSLFEHGSAIQAAASMVYVTALDAIDESTKASIKEALADLPPELVKGIKAHLAEMDPDELHELIENLEEAGAIENDAAVVPFLYWAARAV